MKLGSVIYKFMNFDDIDYYSVIVTFSLLGKFCTSLLKVTNNAFTFELFPTISRGITLAICSTSGKIGSIIAPFIVGLVCCM